MPFPLAAALPAVASLASNIFNTASQSSINSQQLAWSREQFAKERQYALEDWDRNNKYNSPEQQMARLKIAGLNPNLVYGNGSVGNASAPIRSTSGNQPKLEAPRLDNTIAQSLFMMYDMMKKQQETDNLKAQLELIKSKTAGQNFSNEFADGTMVNRIGIVDLQKDLLIGKRDNLTAQTQKTDADRQFTLNQDKRNALTTTANLRQAAEKLLLTRAERAKTGAQRMLINQQIQNLKTDNQLKQMDAQLKTFEMRLNRDGLTKSDPSYIRLASKFLDAILED